MPNPGFEKSPRVVIVGAGFGGLAVARALTDSVAGVTLIDRQNCHVFQPLLYQVATGELTPSEVAVPVREIFRWKNSVRFICDEMLQIDRDRRVVKCRLSEHAYDYLVVATGSQYDYFGHEPWRSLAPPLKTLRDALQIRERILRCFEAAELAEAAADRQRLLTFAVIGGGATGVELSGAIADLARSSFPGEFRSFDPKSARIYLFEAQQYLLPGFHRTLQEYTRRTLTKKGVEVVLGAPVEELEPGRVSAAGDTYEIGTVFWAAGVSAGTIAGKMGARAERAGRIAVTPALTLPDDDRVYVIGDAAHVGTGESGLPALAAVAQQQGRFLGRELAKRLRGKSVLGQFQYRDQGLLATIGRNAAVAQFARFEFTGRSAWFLWGLVHIYLLIGFRNRLMVFVNWVWSYLTRRRGSGLIIGPVHQVPAPDEQRLAPNPVRELEQGPGRLGERVSADSSRRDTRRT